VSGEDFIYPPQTDLVQPRLAADGGACKHLVPPRLKPGVRRRGSESADERRRDTYGNAFREAEL
jgi:hypothetical protein